MPTGIMATDVSLLGVHGMKLERGQRVSLTPTTNLPDDSPYAYFAAPLDGKWSDGVERNLDDSIAVRATDVRLDG